MSAHSRERERPHTRAHKSVSDRPLMVSVSEERPLTLAKNAHERELYSPSCQWSCCRHCRRPDPSLRRVDFLTPENYQLFSSSSSFVEIRIHLIHSYPVRSSLPRPKANDRTRPYTFTYDEKRQLATAVVNDYRARRVTSASRLPYTTVSTIIVHDFSARSYSIVLSSRIISYKKMPTMDLHIAGKRPPEISELPSVSPEPNFFRIRAADLQLEWRPN